MNLTEFTARILILFLPGLICEVVVDRLTIHKERSPFRFVINSFLFGVICYAGFAAWWLLSDIVASKLGIWIIVRFWPRDLSIFKAMVDPKQAIDFVQVALASLLAFPVSFAFAAGINHKFLHRLAHLIRVTRKFAEQDVWGFLLESPQTQWVRVRDLENDLIFEGWVRAFSDVESPRELLLFDVVVYKNLTGERLYEVDAVYLSRENDNITIELDELSRTTSPQGVQATTTEEANG